MMDTITLGQRISYPPLEASPSRPTTLVAVYGTSCKRCYFNEEDGCMTVDCNDHDHETIPQGYEPIVWIRDRSTA